MHVWKKLASMFLVMAMVLVCACASASVTIQELLETLMEKILDDDGFSMLLECKGMESIMISVKLKNGEFEQASLFSGDTSLVVDPKGVYVLEEETTQMISNNTLHDILKITLAQGEICRKVLNPVLNAVTNVADKLKEMDIRITDNTENEDSDYSNVTRVIIETKEDEPSGMMEYIFLSKLDKDYCTASIMDVQTQETIAKLSLYYRSSIVDMGTYDISWVGQE